ncbi:MAG: hypothetical protein ACI9EF_001633 [Pseudohongiellaceae bacterium]
MSSLSTARLLVFFSTLFGGLVVLKTAPTYAGWLLLPMAAFVALVMAHTNARRLGARAQLACTFYEGAMARRGKDWAGQGHDGLDFVDAEHPYARDLDLFGKGSLFELLCTARTALGQSTLARWLAEPASARDARSRQDAVVELAAQTDRREELALLDPEGEGALNAEALCRWASQKPVEISNFQRVAAVALALYSVFALIAWELLGHGIAHLGLAAILCVLQDLLLAQRFKAVGSGAKLADAGLPLLAGLLKSLEEHPAACQTLTTLKEEVCTPLGPPSSSVDRLRKLVGGLRNAELNPFFGPVSFLIRYRVHRLRSIESWRQLAGPSIPHWIAAAGEYEALIALGTYAYEHPDDVMPEIVDGPAQLHGQGLAHPLLPAGSAVVNDVTLDTDHALLLISGSNMSGKSTFLRSIGSAVVLAMAGAPVRAASLTLTPLALGASIQIVDSLLSGESHFYAEIRRLATINELAKSEPHTLFLLDEILHGTNSSDRLAGAGAVITDLVNRGALGLVTTHDLSLTAIADKLGQRAENVHFEDSLIDGRMVFDYRMRPGVVTKGNALELMRSLGLDV